MPHNAAEVTLSKEKVSCSPSCEASSRQKKKGVRFRAKIRARMLHGLILNNFPRSAPPAQIIVPSSLWINTSSSHLINDETRRSCDVFGFMFAPTRGSRYKVDWILGVSTGRGCGGGRGRDADGLGGGLVMSGGVQAGQ